MKPKPNPYGCLIGLAVMIALYALMFTAIWSLSS